jgi:hypothetical protein
LICFGPPLLCSWDQRHPSLRVLGVEVQTTAMSSPLYYPSVAANGKNRNSFLFFSFLFFAAGTQRKITNYVPYGMSITTISLFAHTANACSVIVVFIRIMGGL